MPETQPSPIAIAKRLHAALEAGQHGEQLRALFTADARAITHPNLVEPRGNVATLERILAASDAGAGLLARQTYHGRSALEQGALAILRVTWTGVVGRDRGPLRAGQVMTAHLAQFITCRDGKVAEIETFDCYEPLAAAGG